MENIGFNLMKGMDRRLLALAVILVTLPGCVESPGSRLVGRWQGRPESVQDRAKEKADTPDATQTVLEKFDFTMTLDFVDATQVRMMLDRSGQNQTKLGTWRVVSSAANNLTIDITLSPAKSGSPSKAISGRARQFSLRFDQKNKNRFRLTELNADASVGAILFERNSSK